MEWRQTCCLRLVKHKNGNYLEQQWVAIEYEIEIKREWRGIPVVNYSDTLPGKKDSIR